MVLTKEVSLPSDQDLTTQEIEISTSGLRAASFHMGKVCENVNNVSIEIMSFLLRKTEMKLSFKQFLQINFLKTTNCTGIYALPTRI